MRFTDGYPMLRSHEPEATLALPRRPTPVGAAGAAGRGRRGRYALRVAVAGQPVARLLRAGREEHVGELAGVLLWRVRPGRLHHARQAAGGVHGTGPVGAAGRF